MQERRHPVWRNAVRTLLACLLLTAAAAGQPGMARASGPGPGAGAVSAAPGQGSKRAAALSAAPGEPPAADARLAHPRGQGGGILPRLGPAPVAMPPGAAGPPA